MYPLFGVAFLVLWVTNQILTSRKTYKRCDACGRLDPGGFGVCLYVLFELASPFMPMDLSFLQLRCYLISSFCSSESFLGYLDFSCLFPANTHFLDNFIYSLRYRSGITSSKKSSLSSLSPQFPDWLLSRADHLAVLTSSFVGLFPQ